MTFIEKIDRPSTGEKWRSVGRPLNCYRLTIKGRTLRNWAGPQTSPKEEFLLVKNLRVARLEYK